MARILARLLLVILIIAGCQGMPQIFPPSEPATVREDPGERLFQEAEQYFRRQAYHQAWQSYVAYRERYPKGVHFLTAHLREAEVLGLMGDWQAAQRAYERLLTLPGLESDVSLRARYGLGRATFKLGNYHKAIQVLDSLTAADLPVSLRFATNALLAEIYLKQGRIPQAFARLRLASQDVAAGDQEWFDYLKTRLTEAATPAELENLADLYRDSPLSAVLLLRLAQTAQEAGRQAEAQKWAAILKERFPASKEAAAVEQLLTGEKRLVGCLLPVSGEWAEPGHKIRRGMELAVQGTNLELLVKDCPLDEAGAAQAVRELAQEPRLLLILGPITSAAAGGAAQAAQAQGIPLIALTQKTDVTQAGPLIFQAFLSARAQVRELVRYGVNQMGIRDFALFAPESAYGRTFSQLFQGELTAAGGRLVTYHTYPPGTADLEGALEPLVALYNADPQSPPFGALFIPDDLPAVSLVAAQLAGTPLKQVRLLGTNLAHPAETQESQARGLEGLVFTDAFFAHDPNPAVEHFVAAYRQHYGEAPDYLAAQGYAVVRMLVSLLETDSRITRENLPQKLLAWRDFPDLPWFRGFSPDRLADIAIYILTIEEGRVKMLMNPSPPKPSS